MQSVPLAESVEALFDREVKPQAGNPADAVRGDGLGRGVTQNVGMNRPGADTLRYDPEEIG